MQYVVGLTIVPYIRHYGNNLGLMIVLYIRYYGNNITTAVNGEHEVMKWHQTWARGVEVLSGVVRGTAF
jgi:hypothetical protein